jgi:hypothetical protein
MPQCVHCRGSWRHCFRAMNALPANKVSCQWIATVEPFLSCLRSVWIHMYTNRNVRSLHDNGGRAPFSIRSPACSRHVLYGFTSSALRKNKGSKGSWTYQAPLVEARQSTGGIERMVHCWALWAIESPICILGFSDQRDMEVRRTGGGWGHLISDLDRTGVGARGGSF